jgi:hypothetical protein
MPLVIAALVVGVTNIKNSEKKEIKRYLLGLSEEAEDERLELRLLMDAAFGEEFDAIVDEITDQHVSGEFQGEERKQVEGYFLKSPERRAKAQFAAALIDHASAREEKTVPLPAVASPTLRERWRAFWSAQNVALRFAATAAIVVIAVSLAYLNFRDKPYKSFALLELTISNSERAEGTQLKPLPLTPQNDAAKIFLDLPDQSNQYTSYQAELVDRNGARRNVEITERNQRAVTVIIPASALTRGSYALHLFGNKSDGKQERIPGSYLFMVQ